MTVPGIETGSSTTAADRVAVPVVMAQARAKAIA
jgi:hypothetical protein